MFFYLSKDKGRRLFRMPRGTQMSFIRLWSCKKLDPSEILENGRINFKFNKIENWYYNKRPNKSFIRKSIFYYLKTIFKHNLSTNFIH